MKLEAKQRLRAFQLINQAVGPKPEQVKRLGERYKNELEWVHGASNDPNLTVGFLNYEGKHLIFYIFYNGKCEGNVVFNFLEGRATGLDSKLRLPHLATPHSVLDPSVRSKGIVSFLYRRALESGITLVSEAHTEMASSLWNHLANNSKFYLYHFEAGRVVPEPTPTSVKVLTKKRISNGR